MSYLGFVLVVALVVGGAQSIPALSQQPATTGQNLTVESHQPEAILTTPSSESGALSLPETAASKTVVIDVGHDNRVERSNLSPLVDALVSSGHSVRFYHGERERALNESLRSADAFVVIEPQASYSAAERRGLSTFADAGGRVLLAGEPPGQGSSITALLGLQTSRGGSPAPLTGLAGHFGFAVGDGYVYDLAVYDTNYRNPYASPSGSIGTEAGNVTLHEATTIEGGTAILRTTATSQVSSDRTRNRRTVAAQTDNVTVLGDASLLDSEWVSRNHNEQFVAGMLQFLVSGEKKPGAPAAPSDGDNRTGRPPVPS